MSAKRGGRRQGRPRSDEFQIGPGTVAIVSYELFDAEGEMVEKSEPGEPIELLFGYGDVVPALEQALAGAIPGATREVTLRPEHAFGRRDPAAVIEVDRADLPPDVRPGDEFAADREDGGGTVLLKVIEILDAVVVLDTNHPLADQRVRLRITVEEVRLASSEELAHATRRLTEGNSGPLLPAERLLRRKA